LIDDEQVVERLRRAHDAEPAPQIDPAAALRAGWRWRRRRSVARWSGVAAASVVALSLGGGLAGGWDPFRDGTVEPATEETPEYVAATVLDAYGGVPAGVPDLSGQDGARVSPEEGQVVDLEARTVTLWTGGSYSCPTLPKAIRGHGGTIEIIVGLPDGVDSCTADFSVSTYVVALPSGYDPDGVPVIRVINELAAADADDLPTVMPPRDASACLPALTVCAMDRWLNEMLTAAGVQPPDGASSLLNVTKLVQVGEGEIYWRLFSLDRALERLPMRVLRTNDVGAVVVEHGTEAGGDYAAAEFTCGGFRIEATPGYATDADLLARTVDAVAATITQCPADLDELVARYPDLSPP
jgi:hypothetical protein